MDFDVNGKRGGRGGVLEKVLLWIMDLYFSQKRQFEVEKTSWCFFSFKHSFASQHVNWWTGVVWISCGLLWCFYQLFGLSYWRHPFTAEDPLLSKWWKMLHSPNLWWRNSFSSWMAWEWVHFRQHFQHFWADFSAVSWRFLKIVDFSSQTDLQSTV